MLISETRFYGMAGKFHKWNLQGVNINLHVRLLEMSNVTFDVFKYEKWIGTSISSPYLNGQHQDILKSLSLAFVLDNRPTPCQQYLANHKFWRWNCHTGLVWWPLVFQIFYYCVKTCSQSTTSRTKNDHKYILFVRKRKGIRFTLHHNVKLLTEHLIFEWSTKIWCGIGRTDVFRYCSSITVRIAVNKVLCLRGKLTL